MKGLLAMSALIIPAFILVMAASCAVKGKDAFSIFTKGARDGLMTIAKLFPILCGLLCAVSMLRASGIFDTFSVLLSPVLGALGIPSEVTPLLLIRPFSGSGALAAATDIMKNSGTASIAGRMVAVMLASSETTIYTAGIYFGAAGIHKTRYAIFAALAAELTSFIFSAITVNIFFK
jgi:spore maturation protein B